MAISDYKITESDINASHVQSAEDTLKGTAQQNKAVFDRYSDMIVEKFNGFVDYVSDQSPDEIDEEVKQQFKNAGWVDPSA